MKNIPLAPRGTIINPGESPGRKININVGGETHSPYVSTLKNVPDCPLAWIIRDECRGDLDYDSDSNVYFFDRHPAIFTNILNYFQTGKLHCPRDVCGPMFEEELQFWGIDETQMEGMKYMALFLKKKSLFLYLTSLANQKNLQMKTRHTQKILIFLIFFKMTFFILPAFNDTKFIWLYFMI